MTMEQNARTPSGTNAAPDFVRYLNVRAAYGASFSPDGEA